MNIFVAIKIFDDAVMKTCGNREDTSALKVAKQVFDVLEEPAKRKWPTTQLKKAYLRLSPTNRKLFADTICDMIEALEKETGDQEL